jgi:hypothetical protein
MGPTSTGPVTSSKALEAAWLTHRVDRPLFMDTVDTVRTILHGLSVDLNSLSGPLNDKEETYGCIFVAHVAEHAISISDGFVSRGEVWWLVGSYDDIRMRTLLLLTYTMVYSTSLLDADYYNNPEPGDDLAVYLYHALVAQFELPAFHQTPIYVPRYTEAPAPMGSMRSQIQALRAARSLRTHAECFDRLKMTVGKNAPFRQSVVWRYHAIRYQLGLMPLDDDRTVFDTMVDWLRSDRTLAKKRTMFLHVLSLYRRHFPREDVRIIHRVALRAQPMCPVSISLSPVMILSSLASDEREWHLLMRHYFFTLRTCVFHGGPPQPVAVVLSACIWHLMTQRPLPPSLATHATTMLTHLPTGSVSDGSVSDGSVSDVPSLIPTWTLYGEWSHLTAEEKLGEFARLFL